MPGRAIVPNEAAPHPVLGSGINNLKILVVDDHDIIRRGLKDLLTAKPGWEVCAEAKTGREAVTLAEQLKPEIIVMDISMPDSEWSGSCPPHSQGPSQNRHSHPHHALLGSAGPRRRRSRCSRLYPQIRRRQGTRHRSRFHCQPQDLFHSASFGNASGRFLQDRHRRRTQASSTQSLDHSRTRNRAITRGGKKQQGSCRRSRHQRENRGNPSRQHHAQTGITFRQRTRALRH